MVAAKIHKHVAPNGALAPVIKWPMRLSYSMIELLPAAKNARAARGPGHSKFYPAGAVEAVIPSPFGNGRTTVAAGSDFQLRHVIIFVRPSLLD